MSPIALPDNCDEICCGVCVEDDDLTITGWGADEDDVFPIDLLKIKKGIFEHGACNKAWRNGITSSMFCTSINIGREICGGDSGGPAIRSGVQVGIVSFGTGVCGDGSYPTGYTRIEAPIVRNWIRTVSGI